jgi:hypothetical protein
MSRQDDTQLKLVITRKRENMMRKPTINKYILKEDDRFVILIFQHHMRNQSLWVPGRKYGRKTKTSRDDTIKAVHLVYRNE